MAHDVLDKKLDMLLGQRAVPEMRSNLAYRIIEASRDVPQEKAGLAGMLAPLKELGASFLNGLAGVLDHVALPQPAFAVLMVVMLMGGTVFGAMDAASLLSDFGSAASEDGSSDVETFIMATDSFEYGDFL